MSTAVLDALVREQKTLIAALDADDVDGINRQTVAVHDALVRVRALDARVISAEGRRLAEEAITLTHAARVRVNVLTDMTSRRLARLASATGKGKAAGTYGRNGRLSV